MVSGQRPAPEPDAAAGLTLDPWLRPLQQALLLEAERGFPDLQGRRDTFSTFLARELRQPPLELAPHQQQALAQLAEAYGAYGERSLAQRQTLVRRSRQTLHELQVALRPVQPPAPPRLRLVPDSASTPSAPDRATAAPRRRSPPAHPWRRCVV